jgi:outer membrane protein assembly factor BamB
MGREPQRDNRARACGLQSALCVVIVMAAWVGLCSGADPKQRADWPQLGGSPQRNNAPEGANVPTDWDVQTGRNIKWRAKLGSQTYGNIVVANGQVYVGTNNAAAYLKRYPAHVDLGVLLCFREADGQFLWQHSSEKLPTGRVHDWPQQGICSAPVVEGDRLWFVTSRGEVVCLDTAGFHDDEDDGPVTGVWTAAFHLVSNLSDVAGWLDRRQLPAVYVDTLRPIAAEAGINLPAHFTVEPAVEPNLWFLTTSSKTHSRFLQIVLDEGSLAIAELDEKNNRRQVKVEFDLLAGLDAGRVSSGLRTILLGRGIALPEMLDSHVVEAGRAWNLTAVSGGQPVEVRLELKDSLLSCRQKITTALKTEADVVWSFDMMQQLGVRQHNMATCAPTIWGDVLFICTSNGVDETHIHIPAPDAPSFMAMDKRTGQVLWTDNSPGRNIMHGQWSCPAVGVFDGVPQVLFPGGDGWLYSFRADRWQDGKPELLWKFDGNPKDSVYRLGGQATRNGIIAVPVIHDGLVYLAMGEDPEHGEGPGHLYCLNPNLRGDISAELAVGPEGQPLPARRLQAVDPKLGERAVPNPNSGVVWHYAHHDFNGDGKIDFEETMHRTLGSPTIKNGLLFISDFSGLLHCVDAFTGHPHWTYDLLAACWSTPLIAGDRVYVADEDGDVAIFALSSDRKPPAGRVARTDPEPLRELNMDQSIYTMPVVANNVLYIATKSELFAISAGAKEPRK